MTHRDFELIARVLRTAQKDDYLPINTAQARLLAVHFADELAETNPRFDRDRFLNACIPGPIS